MDRWDIFLIAGAAYLAIFSLVRLMAARRDAVVKELRSQIEAHRAQHDEARMTNEGE